MNGMLSTCCTALYVVWCVQVDNPVSILTQEMSKHFLHSKGEADKYKVFVFAITMHL